MWCLAVLPCHLAQEAAAVGPRPAGTHRNLLQCLFNLRKSSSTAGPGGVSRWLCGWGAQGAPTHRRSKMGWTALNWPLTTAVRYTSQGSTPAVRRAAPAVAGTPSGLPSQRSLEPRQRVPRPHAAAGGRKDPPWRAPSPERYIKESEDPPASPPSGVYEAATWLRCRCSPLGSPTALLQHSFSTCLSPGPTAPPFNAHHQRYGSSAGPAPEP